jgi:hypothetical protein
MASGESVCALFHAVRGSEMALDMPHSSISPSLTARS